MRIFAQILFAGFFAFSLPAQAATPLRVVASFSILGDIVKNVGGDAVTVTTLVGSDSDTHSYQPTPADARNLTTADLVFINGLGFEGWITRLIAASGYKGKVIVVSNGITPRTMIEDGKSVPVIDPHAWQNLANGRIYVKNISLALQQAIPAQTAAIQKRAAHYDVGLVKMDQYAHDQFAGIPATQRKIITSHDAFGYFGAAYGVTFLAPDGVSTEAEPSAADVAKLVEQIKSVGVKQIFIENMTNNKLMTQIGKDTGATMGGTLYSDALSPPNGPAATYLDMFRNNVPKLKTAMMQNK